MMWMKIAVALLVHALIVTGTEARTCAEHLQHWETNESMLLGSFRPRCDPGNTDNYSAVQCRGSECFCADPDGRELGYNTNRGTAMDCNCARDEADYRRLGIIGRMFFCDSKGSYDSVQCRGSVCFCADIHGNRRQDSQEIDIAHSDQLNC